MEKSPRLWWDKLKTCLYFYFESKWLIFYIRENKPIVLKVSFGRVVNFICSEISIFKKKSEGRSTSHFVTAFLLCAVYHHSDALV